MSIVQGIDNPQIDLLRSSAVALRTTALSKARNHLAGLFHLAGLLAPPTRLELDQPLRRLDFVHRYARFPHFSVHRIRYGAPIWMEIPSIGNLCILQILLAGESTIVQSSNEFVATPGTISVLSSGCSFRKHLTWDAEQLLVCFSDALLSSAALAAFPRSTHRPRFSPQPISASSVPMLSGILAAMTEEIDVGSPNLSSPPVSKQMADLVVSLMLRGLPNDGQDSSSPAVPQCIRRAENYMTENSKRDISLTDIANAAGASVRTLCVNFRRFRRTTPMIRLRQIRLDDAKARLATGAKNITVTSVAAECGWHHLGRFAKEYRNRFGELPSRTLTKTRPNKRKR